MNHVEMLIETYSTEIYLISDDLELYTELNWKNMADGIFLSENMCCIKYLCSILHESMIFLLLCSQKIVKISLSLFCHSCTSKGVEWNQKAIPQYCMQKWSGKIQLPNMDNF